MTDAERVTDAERMQTLISEALRATGGDTAQAARLLKRWAADDPEVKQVIRQHMVSSIWPEITCMLLAEGFDAEEAGS